jgi:hypothetical protein
MILWWFRNKFKSYFHVVDFSKFSNDRTKELFFIFGFLSLHRRFLNSILKSIRDCFQVSMNLFSILVFDQNWISGCNLFLPLARYPEVLWICLKLPSYSEGCLHVLFLYICLLSVSSYLGHHCIFWTSLSYWI